MALQILQTGSQPALSDSPIIFAVTGALYVTQSRFQYIADLWVWSGSDASSGSSIVQYAKYPNSANAGIFDFGTVINAKMNDLALTHEDNTRKYKVEFSEQWFSGSGYYQTTPVAWGIGVALDGWGLGGEVVNPNPATLSPYWPILTSGPQTQSFISGAADWGSVWSGSADEIKYTDGTTTATYTLPAQQQKIIGFPLFPGATGFPLTTTLPYSVQAFANGTPVGKPLYIYETCETKWGNCRIKWKNRWGRFDYLDFSLKNIETVTVERSQYKPSVGSWNSATLTVEAYEPYTAVFNTNATTQLLVNTPYVQEEWNTVLKELLLSDEIYWVKDGEYIALTLNTDTVQLLTGRNDKLIQYSMVFNITRPYKQKF